MMEAKDGQAWLGTNGYGSRREEDGVCHDDSATPVRANTVDELHSLQRKPQVVEDRHRLQLQSISASLASMTCGIGPKLVNGDPARKKEMPGKAVTHHQHHITVPTITVSDSDLKFTHVLYNLSPSGTHTSILFYPST